MASRQKIYGVDASQQNTRLLRIKIFTVVDLQHRDFLGSSREFYVKVLLQTCGNRNQTIDVARSRSVKEMLNPLWNQDFLFRVRIDMLLFSFVLVEQITYESMF
jgi:hypothetical protein